MAREASWSACRRRVDRSTATTGRRSTSASKGQTPSCASSCPGGAAPARALLRGFRMPDELPEGCDYSAWQRFRDEWLLAVRIWRESALRTCLRTTRSSRQHGQHVAVHVLKSKRAVSELLEASGRRSPGQRRRSLTDSSHRRGEHLRVAGVGYCPLRDTPRRTDPCPTSADVGHGGVAYPNRVVGRLRVRGK